MKSPFPFAKADTELPNPIGLLLEKVVGNVSVYCRAIVLFSCCNWVWNVPVAGP